MTKKVWISRIEIGHSGDQCRVFLSDGAELEGLQRISPHPISPSGIMTVEIETILGPHDDEQS